MRLSDGLILSGYPLKSCRKPADCKTKAALPINDELLTASLQIVVNAGCLVNSVQVELLKGTLANNMYSNGLTTTAEHILSTISNPNWIDREMMRTFFIEKCGFGSELSLRNASLCVERGIPSPQRLAISFQSQTHPPSWLRLTEEDEVLLKIALMPFIEQQHKFLKVRGQSGDAPDPVWADVDSESETEIDLFWAVDLSSTERHQGHHADADTGSSGSARHSKAPPPTPSQSPMHPPSSALDGPAGTSFEEEDQWGHGSHISSPGSPVSSFSSPSTDLHAVHNNTSRALVDKATEAWPLSLMLPADLEVASDAVDDVSALQEEHSPPTIRQVLADSLQLSPVPDCTERGAGTELRHEEQQGAEEEDEQDQDLEGDDASGDMSSYDSCCSCIIEPTTATVEGYLTRSPSARSLGSLPSDKDQNSMSSYGTVEIHVENGLEVETSARETLRPGEFSHALLSPLTASATSSLSDRYASPDTSLGLNMGSWTACTGSSSGTRGRRICSAHRPLPRLQSPQCRHLERSRASCPRAPPRSTKPAAGTSVLRGMNVLHTSKSVMHAPCGELNLTQF